MTAHTWTKSSKHLLSISFFIYHSLHCKWRYLTELGVLEAVFLAVGNFTILSGQPRPDGDLGRLGSSQVRLGDRRCRRGRCVEFRATPNRYLLLAHLRRTHALDSDVQGAGVFLSIVLPPSPNHPARVISYYTVFRVLRLDLIKICVLCNTEISRHIKIRPNLVSSSGSFGLRLGLKSCRRSLLLVLSSSGPDPFGKGLRKAQATSCHPFFSDSF